MLDFMYQVVIYPIKLIIEIVYMFFGWIFKGNVGISITGVSIAVSLFCLPLYAKAEKLQEIERDIQKKMAKRVASIKSHFKGDEQYMMLSTYYRQNQYHPFLALRSSISLLVQIPFFIAAYTFLSHLAALKGVPFMFIHDMSLEDSLFRIGTLSLNVLPILMTLINVISGAIYSRGFPFKDKAQLYGMALIFLVLLYHSPAALVLYWTLNNVFSLIKNIVFKIKNPMRFLYLVMCSALLAVCVYVFFVRRHGHSNRLRNYILTGSASVLLAAIPLYIHFARRVAHSWFAGLFSEHANRTKLFILASVSTWLLYGIFIPFNVVAASPFEFSNIGSYSSPFGLLFYPMAQALGFCVVWPVYLYALFPVRIKSLLTLGMCGILLATLVNVFILPVTGGTLTQTLQYIEGGIFKTPKHYLMLNVLLCSGLFAGLALLVSKRKMPAVTLGLTVCALSLAGASAYKGMDINSGYRKFSQIQQTESGNGALIENDTIQPVFHLSKTGKNVFIIMMDKAISSYFPLALAESPGLKEKYDGFVYYPNCLSYGQKTIIGAPPLFGGYEYTPESMNRRDGERMVDKHNESLLMLPSVFKKNGYSPLVTDAPFVNYDWIADNSVFTKHGIKAINLMGNYSIKYMKDELPALKNFSADALLKRNFLLFSLLTAVPAPIKKAVYDGGKYGNSSLLSLNTLTLDSYAVLHYLDKMTVADAESDTFTMMVNNLTHEASFLELPGYTFGPNHDPSADTALGKSDYYEIFHVNVASYRLLGKWLDSLKSRGVYDNTRIIIVSDHGARVDTPGFSRFQNETVTPYNPLLLVKDFNGHGQLKTDPAFMTNADLPLLAVQNLLEDTKNPFTGKKISAQDKKDRIAIPRDVIIHQGFSFDLLQKTTCYDKGANAYFVDTDIFDANHWKEGVME